MLNQSFMDIIVKATAEYQTEQASIILSFGSQGAKKKVYDISFMLSNLFSPKEIKLESITGSSVELENIKSDEPSATAEKETSKNYSR